MAGKSKQINSLIEQNRQLMEMLKLQHEFHSGIIASQAILIESIQELRQSMGTEFQIINDHLIKIRCLKDPLPD